MIKFIKKVIVFIIIIFCLFCSYFIYTGYNMYKNAIDEMSIEQMRDSIETKQDYTTLDKMPQIYKDAVIAVEDHRFYSNKLGFDFISIARAIVNNIKYKELKEGGSTITQQLAKNTYFTQDKTLQRKIAEIFMANALEKELTKDEILELYLNTCFFGNNYYSPQSAAIGYFGKNISDLNQSEATMLAGIPNAPSVYNPKANYELAKQRQRQVLERMVIYGYLTQEEMLNILSM